MVSVSQAVASVIRGASGRRLRRVQPIGTIRVRMVTTAQAVVAASFGAIAVLLGACSADTADWTAQERELIRGMALERLGAAPADPSNRYADDPRAVQLGERLFFDKRLSANGQVACASCHQPQRHFSDGLAKSKGVDTALRHAPSLEGAAWARWQFWDGRADSLWAQALGPLEDAHEQGLSRVKIARVVAQFHRDEYEALFGPLPDLRDPARFPADAGPNANSAAWQAMRATDRETVTQVVVNIAKAIAAYERGLRPAPSRFDAYAQSLDDADHDASILSAAEQRGLKLFIGQGQCLRCHSGPLFSNQGFHNTGLASALADQPDRGRADGLGKSLVNELNCASRHNDAQSPDCRHLQYARQGAPEWLGAFKVPTLRNVARTAPYMHDGRFRSLEQVVEHYDRAENPDGLYGHTELLPLALSAREKRDIVAFLGALTAQ